MHLGAGTWQPSWTALGQPCPPSGEQLKPSERGGFRGQEGSVAGFDVA